VSLIGLPPLAGFIAKFLIFSSLVSAFRAGAEQPLMLALLIVGGINTVISLFYYLRVLKVMTFDPLPEGRAAEPAGGFSFSGGLVAALAVPVVVLGILWGGLYGIAQLAGSFAS
jgi:NADH-quinone oxidoreductase subunit N